MAAGDPAAGSGSTPPTSDTTIWVSHTRRLAATASDAATPKGP